MAKLTWLVTGCSSGFGKEFVHSILARGDNVIATGRKVEERLAHLKNTGAAILDLDLSASEEEVTAKAYEALMIYDGIDVLVNNAGYIEFGLAEDFTYVQNTDALTAVDISDLLTATTASLLNSTRTFSVL